MKLAQLLSMFLALVLSAGVAMAMDPDADRAAGMSAGEDGVQGMEDEDAEREAPPEPQPLDPGYSPDTGDLFGSSAIGMDEGAGGDGTGIQPGVQEQQQGQGDVDDEAGMGMEMPSAEYEGM